MIIKTDFSKIVKVYIKQIECTGEPRARISKQLLEHNKNATFLKSEI